MFRMKLPAIATLLVVTSLSGTNGMAQNRPNGRVEIAVLAGLTLYKHPSILDGEAAVGVPVGASFGEVGATPGIRMTYWTNGFLTFDLGASFLFEEDPILGAEVGVGANLRHRTANVQPFVSGLVGFWSNLEASKTYFGGTRAGRIGSGSYVGMTLGTKVFIRDHACWRLQTGIRKGLGDFDESILEILTGLGFFL